MIFSKLPFKVVVLVCCLIGANGVYAQPCMEGWRYRVPITLDNTGNPSPLVDHQIKLTLPTQGLISTGEMKADAGDLRFTNSAGVQLPFWIVNNTLNTTTTEIWVNVDNLPPASTIDIYMFYGNSQALSVIDGDATFLHYDNFDGTALDFGKWTYCGPVIPVVANGEITFNSSSGTNDQMIKSLQSFSGPLTVEMNVNSANTGIASMGQIDAADDGYGMAFENVASVNTMRLVSLDLGNASSCLGINNQSPLNSVNAGNIQGLWSFSWANPSEQFYSWPGGSESRSDALESGKFTNPMHAFVGSYANTGSISVDYIYTRKYSPIVPGYMVGGATELVDAVTATTNAPVCVGDSIMLFAPTFAGAVYDWVGPNSFTSTHQNPIIPVSSFSNVGKYIVTVSSPTGCSAKTDSVIVALDSVPVAGFLSGDTTVCYGTNSGVLQLSGTTGTIIRWESSLSLNGPWSVIANTTSMLTYQNLTTTHYFRAVVEMGSCGLDISNVATVNIDPLTEGGNVLGTANACYGFNTGTLNLIDQVGAIQKWQSSSDQGVSWTDLASTSNQISYTNLTDTTWYRVLVQNGVCDSSFSDTAVISIQPLPMVDFSAGSECRGQTTQLNNNSTIPNGSIVNYSWDFDDGSGSGNVNPAHTYSTHGTYNVMLEAVSDQGCIDSIRKNITVFPLPSVSFTHTDVCDTSTMQFTNGTTIPIGSIQFNIWDYGDGTTPDTLPNGSHLYASYGNYDVTLMAVSDSGCIDSAKRSVRVLRRAIVDFVSDSVCLQNAIQFDNLTTTFQDSTTYNWNFGNGDQSSDYAPDYTYPAYGIFEVVLQATTYGQCINTRIDTVEIYPLPATDFTFESDCQYNPILFENQTSIPYGVVNYNWSFGDSTTGTGQSQANLYNLPGNYFVTLTSVSENGCTTDTTLGVEVFPVPTANFVLSNVCRDTLAPITNTSSISSGSVTYFWDMGDGTTYTTTDPNHMYISDSIHTISLWVTSDEGCRDSIEKDIEIYSIPSTSFTTNQVCFGVPTELTNGTTINAGFVASYQWNLGDGTFSFDPDVIHLYSSSGSYDVSLLATSNRGCSRDTTVTITVDPFPQIAFDFDDACVFDPVQFFNLSVIASGTMTYQWEIGNGTTTSQSSPVEIFDLYGIYPVQLTATSDAGCQDSLTQLIQIFPLPLLDAGPDTSVSYGFTTTLEGVSPAAVNVDWSPGLTVTDNASLVTQARPLETTLYTLTVTDQFGCVNSDEVSIEVILDQKLLISNTLTPNGDGLNDTWKIFNADAFDVIHIEVYDRWGKPVFRADNYQAAWDGNVNLDALSEGTYFYVISFDDSDKVYKGAVSILRDPIN